jgi:hypothetical protein
MEMREAGRNKGGKERKGEWQWCGKEEEGGIGGSMSEKGGEEGIREGRVRKLRSAGKERGVCDPTFQTRITPLDDCSV